MSAVPLSIRVLNPVFNSVATCKGPSKHVTHGKWTAFTQCLSSQWSRNALCSIAYHSTIHTPTAVSTMQGHSQLATVRLPANTLLLLSHTPPVMNLSLYRPPRLIDADLLPVAGVISVFCVLLTALVEGIESFEVVSAHDGASSDDCRGVRDGDDGGKNSSLLGERVSMEKDEHKDVVTYRPGIIHSNSINDIHSILQVIQRNSITYRGGKHRVPHSNDMRYMACDTDNSAIQRFCNNLYIVGRSYHHIRMSHDEYKTTVKR